MTHSWRGRTIRGVGITVVMTLLAIPATLVAQSRRDTNTWGARLLPATRNSIVALADSLDMERLPGSAMIDKAAEGVLKGADDERILSAVRAMAQRVRESRALLGPAAPTDALLASSSALYAGVPAPAIAKMVEAQRARRSTQSLTEPLVVLAELASAQVPMPIAVQSVDALLARGAVDADLRAFRARVDQQMRLGVTPRVAAEESVQRILRGLDRVP